MTKKLAIEVHLSSKLLLTNSVFSTKVLYTDAYFSRKSIILGPLVCHIAVSITSFCNCRNRNFFYRKVSVFSFMYCLFDSGSWWQINIFLNNCVSVRIIHLRWFALLSNHKHENRILFNSWKFYLIYHNFEKPQKKLFCEIKLVFSIN